MILRMSFLPDFRFLAVVGGSVSWNGLDINDPSALRGAIVGQGSETRKCAGLPDETPRKLNLLGGIRS
jgi:hypothetical protein